MGIDHPRIFRVCSSACSSTHATRSERALKCQSHPCSNHLSYVNIQVQDHVRLSRVSRIEFQTVLQATKHTRANHTRHPTLVTLSPPRCLGAKPIRERYLASFTTPRDHASLHKSAFPKCPSSAIPAALLALHRVFPPTNSPLTPTLPHVQPCTTYPTTFPQRNSKPEKSSTICSPV